MFDLNYKRLVLNIEQKGYLDNKQNCSWFEHHISKQTTYVENLCEVERQFYIRYLFTLAICFFVKNLNL